MNQPQLDEVVLVEATKPASPTTTPIRKTMDRKIHQVEVVQKVPEAPVDTRAVTLDRTPSKSKLIGTNWQMEGNLYTVRQFKLVAGETFGETLNKWLAMEGYHNIRSELVKREKSILNRKIAESDSYYSSFPEAIESLAQVAATQRINYDRESPREYQLYISLDKGNLAATIYSVTPTLTIHQTGYRTAAQSEQHNFYLFRGEKFEAALYRWVNKAGYERFGTLLTPEAKQVLGQQSPSSFTFNESFEKATTLLLTKARQQARASDDTERQGFLTDEQKRDLELHLTLNGIKKEAILTSTNQPVSMFTVAPGSLRDNFLRLTHDFGWKATQKNYLGKDYRVTFSYPIVAEKGNLKAALSLLLADYPKLRGGIVPSTREAYVMTEK
ncbi:hypothetical protein [Vibrio sp.]|uniref:hypothetical protein n=1 Tax=Vibrio sp. TaxID=678 RepID=UPI003D0E8891